MKPIDVVLDTNVIVSALRSKQGASHRLLLALTKGYYRPFVSIPLFLEYESVLKRAGLVQNLSEDDIDQFLSFFLSRAQIQPIYFLWRPHLSDPKDDMVLELAIAAQSRLIITFNSKDFKGVGGFGIETLTPQQFLQQYGVLS